MKSIFLTISLLLLVVLVKAQLPQQQEPAYFPEDTFHETGSMHLSDNEPDFLSYGVLKDVLNENPELFLSFSNLMYEEDLADPRSGNLKQLQQIARLILVQKSAPDLLDTYWFNSVQPDYSSIYLAKAYTALRANKPNKAYSYLMEAEPTTDRDLLLAQYYLFQKDPAQAKETLAKIPLSQQENQAYQDLSFAILFEEKDYPGIRSSAPVNLSEKPEWVRLILAETYLNLKDYQRASAAYEMLIRTASYTDEVALRHGYTLFKTKSYEQSIAALQPVADANSLNGQRALFLMGISNLSVEKFSEAGNAFQKAYSQNFDPSLQELAGYIAIQIALTAGDESTFNRLSGTFSQAFPTSPYQRSIQELKAIQLLSANNPEKALDTYDEMGTLEPRLKILYQKMAYNLGVEAYNDQNYQLAENQFKRSLVYTPDAEIKNKTSFYLAELYYETGKTRQARENYQQVGTRSDMYGKALMGLGYLAFQNKNYSSAESYFSSAVTRLASTNAQDVQARLADIRFLKKDYAEAIKLYKRAGRGGLNEYLAYQLAKSYEGAGRITSALEQYTAYLEDYPASVYRSEALFSLGNLYSSKNQFKDALRTYNIFLTEFSGHKYTPQVLSRAGNAAVATKAYDQVKSYYNRLLSDYGRSGYAESAMLGLIDLNKLGKLSDSYLKEQQDRFKALNPESNFLVRTALDQAKSILESGNISSFNRAIDLFLDQYPESTYRDEALYYQAYGLELARDTLNAVRGYAQITAGPLQYKSVKRAANLLLGKPSNPLAQTTFQDLLKLAETERDKLLAQRGLLEFYFSAKKWGQADSLASLLLQDGQDRYDGYASLSVGKILLEKGFLKDAENQFKKTEQAYPGAIAAESRYLMGYALHLQNEFEKSIEVLLELRKQYDNYPNWLYKGFLLNAENYVATENYFQAEATLQSLVDYAEDKAIRSAAGIRLKEVQEIQAIKEAIPSTKTDSTTQATQKTNTAVDTVDGTR